MTKRAYRGTVQAEVAARTRQRVMDVTLHLFENEWLDEVTLQRVAAESGVTVQTILRHFASKDGLMAAVAAQVREATVRERTDVPAGDIDAAVVYLVQHYEAIGERIIRLLAQEERYPLLKEILEGGRVFHRAWVERVFGPYLSDAQMRGEHLPQLAAVCDVYIWKLLRRDMALSADAYQKALGNLIAAVLRSPGG